VGLLEALSGGSSGARSGAAVTRHLQSLLSSVQGYSCIRSEYGVRGKATLGAPGPEAEAKLPEERLRQELLRNVEEFEPALREPELTLGGRDSRGQLHFFLTARLFAAEQRACWRIRFNVWSRELLVEEAST
jgi:hypothetical protein